MYYKIGEETRRVIDVEGFKLIKIVTKYSDYITVKITTLNEVEIDSVDISDESDVLIAVETLNQAIFEWLEQNTDEYDRIYAVLTRGDLNVSGSGYTYPVGHSRY